MFTYLVSPTNQTSYIFAISVHEDTITIYKHAMPMLKTFLDSIPFVGRTLSQWYLASSLDSTSASTPHFKIKYQIDKSTPTPSAQSDAAWKDCYTNFVNAHPSYTFTHFEDYGHDELHGNSTEHYISHTHLQTYKKVSSDDLKLFLKDLKDCEQLKDLSPDETLLPREVQRDIIKHYNRYLKTSQKHHAVHSNNPCYDKKNMPQGLPGVYEHVQCLKEKESVGCLPKDPITPECKALAASTASADYTLPTLASTAALGAFGIGLFARWKRHRQAEPQANNQHTAAIANQGPAHR